MDLTHEDQVRVNALGPELVEGLLLEPLGGHLPEVRERVRDDGSPCSVLPQPSLPLARQVLVPQGLVGLSW